MAFGEKKRYGTNFTGLRAGSNYGFYYKADAEKLASNARKQGYGTSISKQKGDYKGWNVLLSKKKKA